MRKLKYPFELKYIRSILKITLGGVSSYYLGKFLEQSGIVRINISLLTICIFIIILLLYWLFRHSWYLKKVNKDYSPNTSKSSNNGKKKLPRYFSVDKTITNGHSNWMVRVDSSFHPLNEDIEFFISCIEISDPFCRKCSSNFDKEYDGYVCKNRTCKNRNLVWKFESEKQEGNELLNTFIGEVRKNPKEWLSIYKEKYDRFTNGSYDDYKIPQFVGSVPR